MRASWPDTGSIFTRPFWDRQEKLGLWNWRGTRYPRREFEAFE